MQDLTTVSRGSSIGMGSRVEIDLALGRGTVVARIDCDTIDGSMDASEDWLLVAPDDDLWAWKGRSCATEGEQAVAFIRVMAVSVSNLTCID